MEENDLEAVKMYFKLLSNSPTENINKHYKRFIKECKATGKKVMLEYLHSMIEEYPAYEFGLIYHQLTERFTFSS